MGTSKCRRQWPGTPGGSGIGKRILLLVVLLLILCAPLPSPASEVVARSESAECLLCHEKLAAQWQSSRHARAFESLKKTGQEALPGCTPCHVTGYGKPGGFTDAELTPWLAGVQCRECHGPGVTHRTAPARTNIIALPGIETCRRCHTAGQDPGFDYQTKVKWVHATPVSSEKTKAKPVLLANPDHFNFGLVEEGSPVIALAELTNPGDRSLTVSGLRTN